MQNISAFSRRSTKLNFIESESRQNFIKTAEALLRAHLPEVVDESRQREPRPVLDMGEMSRQRLASIQFPRVLRKLIPFLRPEKLLEGNVGLQTHRIAVLEIPLEDRLRRLISVNGLRQVVVWVRLVENAIQDRRDLPTSRVIARQVGIQKPS